MTEVEALRPLSAAQRKAADPAHCVWVGASAGSGKTQVLSARVLRLLLDGVSSQAILCLTFTRAGAAEMAKRVLDRLALWAGADAELIAGDISALGDEVTPERTERARRLFADVLDCEGGLPILTIHAFAQSLLARFPLEAGLSPGFETLDDRARALLEADTAETLYADVVAGRDARAARDLRELALKSDESRLGKLLGQVRTYKEGLASLVAGGDDAVVPRLRAALGLPRDGTDEEVIAGQLSDEAIRRADLEALCRAEGLSKHGRQSVAVLRPFLDASPVQRAGMLDDFVRIWLTEKYEPRAEGALLLKTTPDREALLDICLIQTRAAPALHALRMQLETASKTASLVRIAARREGRIAAAKRAGGLADYDDLIHQTAGLFRSSEAGAWVRYKLGYRIEHVLVDEGQDTNADQWAIVQALTEEFFTGEPQGNRSIFAVGDVKQAIFGFQGTDPAAFTTARDHYRHQLAGIGRKLELVPLDTSYRSVPAVLRVVDTVLAQLGPTALGLDEAALPHDPSRKDAIGSVTLWAPVEAEPPEEAGEWSPGAELAWQPRGPRKLARLLAKQIASWVQSGERLAASDRPMRWGDIMILMRKRTDLAYPLVAELKAAGVPVAGVDRTQIAEPLAIRDMAALLRVLLTPQDDLSLATVLRSPLLGWSEEALFALAHDRGRQTLWRRLADRAQEDAQARAAVDWLNACRTLADTGSPFRLLDGVLGALGGLARMVARLGEEARDPLSVLLDEALAYEAQGAPSIQGFLASLDASEAESRRDPDAPRNEVRVLTVHGSKGLQAPVVILADALRVDQDREALTGIAGEDGVVWPLWFGTKDNAVGRIGDAREADKQRALQEDRRLLYVAMTRAEDRLYVAGWLQSKTPKAAPDPWYRLIEGALTQLGAESVEDPRWGTATTYTAGTTVKPAETSPRVVRAPVALPAWAQMPAPEEPLPTRPLSPSRLGEAPPADSPLAGGSPAARLRGTLAHRLLEQLPDIDPARRAQTAARWLAAHGSALAEADQAALAAEVLAVLDDPAFAPLFAAGSKAEVAVSGVIGRQTIAGQVDRLVTTADRVLILDYKTGSAIPAGAEATPQAYLAQMAAYRAVLQRVYPGRHVAAALLWTAGPRLVALPDDLLDRYAPVA